MKLIDTINKILEARNQQPLDEYEEQEVKEALKEPSVFEIKNSMRDEYLKNNDIKIDHEG